MRMKIQIWSSLSIEAKVQGHPALGKKVGSLTFVPEKVPMSTS